MSKNDINDGEASAVKLLQEINSGITDPKILNKQDRQLCVEMLVSEGYTHFQIAQVLKCSEKTISRDMKDIRQHNELTPNLEFAKQFVGEVFQKAMNHHNYLMRLARMKDASISEKMQSEFAAWKVLKEWTERLQSLGYLPSKPTEVIGTFFHHSDSGEDNSPDAMRKMLLNIEQAAKDADLLDSEMTSKIDMLKARIHQSEITSDIKLLEAETLKNERQEQ
jgi:transposase